MVYEGAWVSHRLRDDLLRLYLPQLPRSEIVAFVDGYVLFLVGGEKEMLAKYSAFGSPIVFAAEDNCWPYAGFANSFPESDAPCRYLNGGGLIGESGAILDLLHRYSDGPPSDLPSGLDVEAEYRTNARAVDALYPWSNQYYWSLVYLNHSELIALDREAALFAAFTLPPTTSKAERDEFRRNGEASLLNRAELERFHENYEMTEYRIRRKATGASPVQVHFNGQVAKLLAANALVTFPFDRRPVDRASARSFRDRKLLIGACKQ